MKKALLLTLVLIPILIGAAAVPGALASGQSEKRAPGYDRPGPPQGRGYAERPAPTFSEETIAVTGPVYFRNRIHPELQSGGQEYDLLVPHVYAYELGLKDGQTITVEGHKVTGMPRFEGEDAAVTYLWLTKAVIDGKEYDVKRYRGGRHRGGRGPGWGPCDGPGPDRMGQRW
jgi:hypothetical protein